MVMAKSGINKIYCYVVLDHSMTEQVLLANDPESIVFSFLCLILDLPGTGLIVRPIHRIHMNLPSISLGPV
jgi:hypothetical protein